MSKRAEHEVFTRELRARSEIASDGNTINKMFEWPGMHAIWLHGATRITRVLTTTQSTSASGGEEARRREFAQVTLNCVFAENGSFRGRIPLPDGALNAPHFRKESLSKLNESRTIAYNDSCDSFHCAPSEGASTGTIVGVTNFLVTTWDVVSFASGGGGEGGGRVVRREV